MPHTQVLVTADLVTGKSFITEVQNDIVRRGYSAIYYFNSTQHYQLAQSALRLHDGSIEVDVPLSETQWLDKLRLSQDWVHDDHLSITHDMEIRGKRYIVSAKCYNKNQIIDANGAETDPKNYDGSDIGPCLGYLVQGMPWAAVKPSLDPAYAWQVSVYFQCSKQCTHRRTLS